MLGYKKGRTLDKKDHLENVSAIENRQGFKIACLEEIAFNNKWIGKKDILKAIQFYGKCDYTNYLKKLIS